jgi:hypothetical protein
LNTAPLERRNGVNFPEGRFGDFLDRAASFARHLAAEETQRSVARGSP